MTRLSACFERARAEGRPLLVAYLTVGDPDVEASLEHARALIEGGAEVLELGVPFSDPTADGPVIAAAAFRALRQGGASLRATLGVARRLRSEHPEVPLVLFSYVNPLLAHGVEQLPADAVAAGCDALLVVDLPPEEGADLRAAARAAGLAMVPLVAPTTPEGRWPVVLSGAGGFVYLVSVAGVTGSAHASMEEAARRAAALRRASELPVVVGFGVDGSERARVLARAGVDGVVVGTHFVQLVARGGTLHERRARLREAAGELARALRSP